MMLWGLTSLTFNKALSFCRGYYYYYYFLKCCFGLIKVKVHILCDIYIYFVCFNFIRILKYTDNSYYIITD